jgi:hypothetical protein
VDFQPLSDKANSRLANWLGKFFSTAVRKTLVQSVLSSQPVYFLSALNAPAEVIEEIDRRRKRFLWTGTDQIAGGGGGCKVPGSKVCRPTCLGGLGILDLKKFACPLRLRWLWHEWKALEKPWVGMRIPCTNEDRRLFEKSTKITIGNDETAGFWGSSWLMGDSPKGLAPSIYSISRRRSRSVANTLLNDAWINDIDVLRIRSAAQLREFTTLWERVRGLQLNPDVPDSIVWIHTKHGHYTTATAYEVQFHGLPTSPMENLIWRAWAPPKCKFFS